MRKEILIFLCLLLPVISTLGAEPPLARSQFKIPTSNGLVVSVYNVNAGHIDYVYPHIFALVDSGQYVHPFIGNITLKGNYKPLQTKYLENTHIITCHYKDFDLYYLASFTRQDKVFYIIARGNKEKIRNLDFDAQTGAGTVVNGIDHLENPLEDLPVKVDGTALKATILKPYKNGIYEKYFMFSFTDFLHTDKTIVDRTAAALRQSNSSLVDEELRFMRRLISSCKIPETLTPAERNVVEQGVSVLKMSQVSDKEIFPRSHGQIIASIRPGLWHTAWVRDGVFAIEAMIKLRMFSEAKKGLEFMLNARPTGQFEHYIYKDGKDYGAGVPYVISLTRYFGNGREECDFNEYGPNIEFDGWGLFLQAFVQYINTSGDGNFYNKWRELVARQVAVPILHARDATGLIKADSGPWEHHLALVKKYTFTTGVSARGLEMFARLQRVHHLPYLEFAKGAAEMKQALKKYMLIDDRYFKGNAEDVSTRDHEYWDGGTFEIFANGLITDKKLFASHMQAYDSTMRIQGPRDGYIRLRSTDPYENQEWVFMNLRIALAHFILGDRKRGYELTRYLSSQASANFNLLPEMISNEKQMKLVTPEFYQSEVWCNCIRDKDGQYIGMVPMVGYGAGAYLISLLTYYEK